MTMQNRPDNLKPRLITITKPRLNRVGWIDLIKKLTKKICPRGKGLYIYDWDYKNNEEFEECPWFLSQVPPDTKLIVLHKMPFNFNYKRLDFLENFMPHELYMEEEAKPNNNEKLGTCETVTTIKEPIIISKTINPIFFLTSDYEPTMKVDDFMKHGGNETLKIIIHEKRRFRHY